MNLLDLFRALFGLAITLGLIGLAAWGVRRYAPQLMSRLQTERKERRLQIVETLVLDPSRRLVLVRVDNEERLVLLGEGRELIEPRAQPADVTLETDTPNQGPQASPRDRGLDKVMHSSLDDPLDAPLKSPQRSPLPRVSSLRDRL